MKSFKQFLNENVLLEFKEWHQFVKHNGDSILDKIGHTEEYAKLSSEPGHGTPEHKTNYIKSNLGLTDMSQEHGRWVLHQLHNDRIGNIEDIGSTITDNLQKFEKIKSEGKITTKLSKVNSPTELYNIVSKHDPHLMDERHGLTPGKDYSVAGENEHWTVYRPHTKKGSCGLGANTNWCTASKTNNRFDHYNESGRLMIFIPKKPSFPGEKYQSHVPNGDLGHSADNIEFRGKHDETIYTDNRAGPEFSKRPLPELRPQITRKGLFRRKIITDDSGLIGLVDTMKNPNAPHEDKIKAIQDPTHGSKFIIDALKSPHLEVARAALSHPESGLNPDNFAKPNESHREHVEEALLSPHLEIARAALDHPEFKEGKIQTFFTSALRKSPHLEIARAVLNHPKFGTSRYHFSAALESPHEEIVHELRTNNFANKNYTTVSGIEHHGRITS